MSRVAAAITIPETNAAKQENSTRSFSTPIMAVSLDAGVCTENLIRID